jgi:hypothetical protein
MEKNRKRSWVWKHFTISITDSKFANCNICNGKASRGSADPKNQSISCLLSHLKTRHPLITEKSPASTLQKTTENSEKVVDPNPRENRKRTIPIFNIRSKKQRTEMLQSTIPEWVETSSKIDSNSEKGQKFHKSIFEMIILDLQPWCVVNDPGFLRHSARFTPNFEIASEKYYRSMLDPAYQKIKSALKDRLEEEETETVSIGLDAWSRFHHGYMGMTIHFITKDWERVKFCLACSKFDERHTAANIFQRIESTAEDWDITTKIGVCLRDNAANVKAAFNEPGCLFESAGCLNHSLQLVIKKELFELESVETLIDKCRKLCSHASHSNPFYTELYKQQELQMGNKNRLGLKNDVATRWNSTFYMLERILHLKPAIAATLLNLPSSGVEFTREDWNICEKVVQILGIFEEATKLLSGRESCISSCIPIVTTIIQSLENSSADDELAAMKHALKAAMEVRFAKVEQTEHYSISTLLDPRFKHYFFRSLDACQQAKNSILTQLDASLPSQNDSKKSSENAPEDDSNSKGFSNMMKKIIAQSQANTNQNSSTKLTKEVLNDYLDCQISSHSSANIN